jgi:hypothetical protein
MLVVRTSFTPEIGLPLGGRCSIPTHRTHEGTFGGNFHFYWLSAVCLLACLYLLMLCTIFLAFVQRVSPCVMRCPGSCTGQGTPKRDLCVCITATRPVFIRSLVVFGVTIAASTRGASQHSHLPTDLHLLPLACDHRTCSSSQTRARQGFGIQLLNVFLKCIRMALITRWFKYDRDYLCVNKSQFVPVIFEPPYMFTSHN